MNYWIIWVLYANVPGGVVINRQMSVWHRLWQQRVTLHITVHLLLQNTSTYTSYMQHYCTFITLTAQNNLYWTVMYLLQPWQTVSGVMRFAIRSVISINRVDAMWSRHVAVQRAVAHQGKSLKGNHGVLAWRHWRGHSRKTQVGRLLWNKRKNRITQRQIIWWSQELEELWGALTLFGPSPPKAEGDESDNDEDEGSQDDTNYKIGEVARPRYKSAGVSQPVVWGLWWNWPLVIRTSWGDRKWERVLKSCVSGRKTSALAWKVKPHLSFQGSPHCQIHSLPSRWSSAFWCRRRSQAGGQWLNASICRPPPHPSYSHCHYRCLLVGSRCRNRRWVCCLQECTVEGEINRITITMKNVSCCKILISVDKNTNSSSHSPSIWEWW